MFDNLTVDDIIDAYSERFLRSVITGQPAPPLIFDLAIKSILKPDGNPFTRYPN